LSRCQRTARQRVRRCSPETIQTEAADAAQRSVKRIARRTNAVHHAAASRRMKRGAEIRRRAMGGEARAVDVVRCRTDAGEDAPPEPADAEYAKPFPFH